MDLKKDIRGVTLVETVLYVGLLALLVSTYVALLTQLTLMQDRESIGGRLAESSNLVLNQVTHFVENAQRINISSSTLGTNTSILLLTDASGASVTIDTVV